MERDVVDFKAAEDWICAQDFHKHDWSQVGGAGAEIFEVLQEGGVERPPILKRDVCQDQLLEVWRRSVEKVQDGRLGRRIQAIRVAYCCTSEIRRGVSLNE